MSVEAGRIPDGVTVFYERDPEQTRSRGWLTVAGLFGLVTASAAANNSGDLEVLLMVIFTAMAAVMAIPPERAEAPRLRVLLVSARGLISRDDLGLRNWDFAEIREVTACTLGGEAHLCLEMADGHHELLDHMSFSDGEKIDQAIRQQIEARRSR